MYTTIRNFQPASYRLHFYLNAVTRHTLFADNCIFHAYSPFLDWTELNSTVSRSLASLRFISLSLTVCVIFSIRPQRCSLVSNVIAACIRHGTARHAKKHIAVCLTELELELELELEYELVYTTLYHATSSFPPLFTQYLIYLYTAVHPGLAPDGLCHARSLSSLFWTSSSVIDTRKHARKRYVRENTKI